jgi:hypothetical protein
LGSKGVHCFGRLAPQLQRLGPAGVLKCPVADAGLAKIDREALKRVTLGKV